jgi:hypothetical protein
VKRAVTLHLALVSAHPAEADARQELDTDAPYLGRWIAPLPVRAEVYVFADDTTATDLEREGWEQA